MLYPSYMSMYIYVYICIYLVIAVLYFCEKLNDKLVLHFFYFVKREGLASG